MNIKNLKIWIKMAFGKSKIIYPVLSLTVPNISNRKVTEKTQLCIEGFPRSGNTFLYHYFKYFNQSVNVAHHVHVPFQFISAIKFGIPCVIVIREPLNTIASLIAVDENLSIGLAIDYYLDYMQTLDKYKTKCYIINNKDLNDNVHELLRKINRQWGTDFHSLALTPDIHEDIKIRLKKSNESNILPMLEPLPNANKAEIKNKLFKRITANERYLKALEVYNEIKD